MNRFVRTARALALASLVALLATAVAQGMMHGGARAPGSATTAPGAAFGPMGMGFGMHQTQTVDEASFLVHMIPHHLEAVASAETLRAATERPELQALADAIITSQSAEIASMEGWLDAWYPNAVRDVTYVPMMRDVGTGAAVADVERAFLEDMIGHHMMAVHEAQTLLAGGLAEHDEVAALARSVVVAQMGEMHQMAAWLGAWFDVAAPMGMGFGAMGDATTGMGSTRMGSTRMGSMGMGMPGSGTPGMGMGAADRMHGMGGHGGGGDGMHPHGGRASMAEHHRAMHGGATGTTIGAAEAERLALAFLAGRGEVVDRTAIADTAVTFEIVVRIGDAERVLRVDARTGEVTLALER